MLGTASKEENKTEKTIMLLNLLKVHTLTALRIGSAFRLFCLTPLNQIHKDSQKGSRGE